MSDQFGFVGGLGMHMLLWTIIYLLYKVSLPLYAEIKFYQMHNWDFEKDSGNRVYFEENMHSASGNSKIGIIKLRLLVFYFFALVGVSGKYLGHVFESGIVQEIIRRYSQ